MGGLFGKDQEARPCWRRCVFGGGLVGGGVSLHVDLLKEVHHCVWTCLKRCVIGEGLVGEGVPLGVDFEDSKGLYHSLYFLSFASYLQIKMWALQFSAIIDFNPLKL